MRRLGRSGDRARLGVWRRGSRGGASQVIEAGTGVGLAWRARCRGVAGPAGGKTARHAARGPRFRDRGGLSVPRWKVTAIMKGGWAATPAERLRGTPQWRRARTV